MTVRSNGSNVTFDTVQFLSSVADFKHLYHGFVLPDLIQ